jgi:hypothetical protein
MSRVSHCGKRENAGVSSSIYCPFEFKVKIFESFFGDEVYVLCFSDRFQYSVMYCELESTSTELQQSPEAISAEKKGEAKPVQNPPHLCLIF